MFDRPSGLVMPWEAPGASEDDNLDFYAAADETMAQVLEFCKACFDHADTVITEWPVDAPGTVPWWPEDRREVTLWQVMNHVALDEARHAGHADILREHIDGATGLRAPGNNLPSWPSDQWTRYVTHLTKIAETRTGRSRGLNNTTSHSRTLRMSRNRSVARHRHDRPNVHCWVGSAE